jgi:hypothetical protein
MDPGDLELFEWVMCVIVAREVLCTFPVCVVLVDDLLC